jgi:hypothetical protein
MTLKDLVYLNKKLNYKSKDAYTNFQKFKIGDKVRHLQSKKTFQKGQKQYSNKIYTIYKIEGYSFYLEDDKYTYNEPFKYYELKKVNEIDYLPTNDHIPKGNIIKKIIIK